MIRDCEYQPERFVDQVEMDHQLLNRKRELLIDGWDSANDKKAWHDELTDINERLYKSLADFQIGLHQKLSVAVRNQANEGLLASREHPFCIFELDDLLITFKKLLGRDA